MPGKKEQPNIEDLGNGKHRIRWQFKDAKGKWRYRQYDVPGSFKDADKALTCIKYELQQNSYIDKSRMTVKESRSRNGLTSTSTRSKRRPAPGMRKTSGSISFQASETSSCPSFASRTFRISTRISFPVAGWMARKVDWQRVPCAKSTSSSSWPWTML